MRALLLAALALGLGLLTSCNGRWPADMDVQPSIGPVAGPRPPPVGAVAFGVTDVVESRDDLEDAESPVADDPEAATRGRALFAIDCAVCHGSDGHGHGRLADKMPPAPDLRHISICRRTDGFIYGTLTKGGRAMPSLREQLSSRQRWDLVAYVRQIQAEGCTGSTEGMSGEAGAGEAVDAAPADEAPEGAELDAAAPPDEEATP